jgi:hypothetical protein
MTRSADQPAKRPANRFIIVNHENSGNAGRSHGATLEGMLPGGLPMGNVK